MRISLLAGAIACAASPAMSFATVIFHADFEPATYSPGALIGQHGWNQFDGDSPFANLNIQSSVVRPSIGGSQSLHFQTTGAAADSFSDFTDVWTGSSGVSAAQLIVEPIVRIQFDMMRGPLGAGEDPTIAWGIDIFDSTAFAAATIVVMDDVDGPILTATDAVGNLVTLGSASPRGTWDTYAVELNYDTRHYSVAINNVTLGSPQDLNALASDAIGDVDFLAWLRGTDSAYFDNFSVTTSAVPEPSLMPMLGAMIGVIGCRRRR